MPEPRYYTTAQVAEMLNISEDWVRRKIASGELPAVVLSRKSRRISSEDLERFLARRRQGQGLIKHREVRA